MTKKLAPFAIAIIGSSGHSWASGIVPNQASYALCATILPIHMRGELCFVVSARSCTHAPGGGTSGNLQVVAALSVCAGSTIAPNKKCECASGGGE